MVIKEHPDPAVSIVRTAAGSAVLFSVSQGDPTEVGLYLHGPMR